MDLHVGLGVAVREFPLLPAGRAPQQGTEVESSDKDGSWKAFRYDELPRGTS